MGCFSGLVMPRELCDRAQPRPIVSSLCSKLCWKVNELLTTPKQPGKWTRKERHCKKTEEKIEERKERGRIRVSFFRGSVVPDSRVFHYER